MARRADKGILSQLQRNAVALISLVIAITSLGYNTWRNEQSEENRTQRAVALEVLMKLGELQQVVYHHYYEQDFRDRGNKYEGWTLVRVIRDIGTVLEQPVKDSTEDLLRAWSDEESTLGTREAAAVGILDAIDAVRRDTLALLASLD